MLLGDIMKDSKGRAFALERRYRMLSQPWKDMLVEIRAERGLLLGTKQYEEMVGIEKAKALDTMDERLVMVQNWLLHYEKERTNGVGKRKKKWLKEASLMSDAELEGVI